ATYAKWRERQKQTRMPMVTVLRGQQGKLNFHSVSPAPSEIVLSELPKELLIAKAPPKPPTPQKSPTPPPQILSPLIVSGKKPAPPAEIAETKPAQPVSVVAASTNFASPPQVLQTVVPAVAIPAATLTQTAIVLQTNQAVASLAAPPA